MGIPEALSAGDTWAWSDSVASYPADQGWTLAYAFLTADGSASKITLSATASGADYAVAVAASVTAGYAPGTYSYIGRVSKAGEVHTVFSGSVSIAADLAAKTAYDSRSVAAKALAKIDAWLAGDKSFEVASYVVGDRQLQHHDPSKIMAMRSQLMIEVSRETAATSGIDGRRYYVRMGRG